MEEVYRPAPREGLLEKVNLFLGKEGPYIFRTIFRTIVGIVVWLIKSVKSLFIYFLETMKRALGG